MDGELVRQVYHELFHVGKPEVPTRCNFSDATILFIYFLAVASGRSVYWAHHRRNWPLWARHLPRPSYSQIMRRLKTGSIQAGLDELNARFRDRLPRTKRKFIDGKPLTVGVFSKDPDAKWGKLSNERWACGYKIHVLADFSGAFDAFAVTPLNVGEAPVARHLVHSVDLDQVTVRGDASYDSNALYAAVALQGGRLIAPRKRPGRGIGHHRQHPDRLRAIDQLEGLAGAAASHRRQRVRVEQTLAHLTNLPFGLSPLPNCVRRLVRVERWIKAKITLYHLHLSLTRNITNAA
jgi:hypothetical protein